MRTIGIADACPQCGSRRGSPEKMHQCDDGVHYWVDVWSNPCEHEDPYVQVLKEAEERGSLGPVRMH